MHNEKILILISVDYIWVSGRLSESVSFDRKGQIFPSYSDLLRRDTEFKLKCILFYFCICYITKLILQL